MIDATRSRSTRRGRKRFEALLARREAREPVAYILGRKEFRRISLQVDRRVLIPRPETELLVEVGLGSSRGARVADVGTGSGAVALALKDERPDLAVLGVDVSAGCARCGPGERGAARLDVDVRRGDLLDGIAGRSTRRSRTCRTSRRVPTLPPEIARYEPPVALFAGPDGLDADPAPDRRGCRACR